MRATRASHLVPGFVIVLAACADLAVAPEAFDGEPAFAKPAAGFTDEFDTFDSSRWSAEEHPLGKGWFRAANVSVAAGLLRLKSPAGTMDGGEIASLDRFRSGRFTARLRCAMPAGTVCAFFLYEGVPGDRNDEIDIEILAGTPTLWMTTWSRGRQTNHTEITLPFDPAATFHEYTIEYGRSAIAFFVDGVAYETFTSDLPRRSMKLLANAWWPTWMNAPVSPVDTFMEIDWIEVR